MDLQNMNNDKVQQYYRAFRAYDIRGKVPDELDENLAYFIGYCFVQMFLAKKVVVGFDIRRSSTKLFAGLSKGITDAGADVLDIGLCGTEQVYFATSHLKADGGIMITASHNPIDYNGMKIVLAGSRPLSSDNGLFDLRDIVLAANSKCLNSGVSGKIIASEIIDDYCQHVLSYINIGKVKPLRIVANAGHGCAGLVMKKLQSYLPCSFKELYYEPNGDFPQGIPNPLLPENRKITEQAVLENQADLGIAWDGDFDRCFFFTGDGEFVEGYYIVGLLAEAILQNNPGEKIIHDPRLLWNTEEVVKNSGGVPVLSKTGHGYIKDAMRKSNAVYGGEMSAHHYFRDFAYCDSGMIPWVLLVELMSTTNKTLTQLISDKQKRFPCSGEINRKVMDSKKIIDSIEKKYLQQALNIYYVDGLSMDFVDWRFNLRSSNTEPLLRLNVESRGNQQLVKEKTDEVLKLMEQ